MTKPSDPQNNVMTILDVSVYLKIPVSTVYEWAKKGIIRGVKIGKHWRFLENNIHSYLYSQLINPKVQKSQVERRQAARLNTELPAEITVLLMSKNGTAHQGTIQNISESGALFAENRTEARLKQLAVGDPIQVQLILPNGAQQKITVEGRVVHRRTPKGESYGIKFRHLTDKNRLTIRKYID